MSFLLIIIAFTFVLKCHCGLKPRGQLTCIPRYHAWKPLFGAIPEDAFEAGIDRDGVKKYIARIITADKRSWSAPTTLSEKTVILHYNWAIKKQTANKVAEVLILLQPDQRGYEQLRGFGWRRANQENLKQLSETCCFVEAGSGYQSGKKFVTWIGRTIKEDSYYIGGVRDIESCEAQNNQPMTYLDDTGINYSISENFEILAYDCCTVEHCQEPNKAECCFDILE